MKASILFLFSLFLLSFSVFNEPEWLNFIQKYRNNGKDYKTTKEYNLRHSIFMNELKHINKHNQLFKQGKMHYKLNVNSFADRTVNELQRITGYNILKTDISSTKGVLEHSMYSNKLKSVVKKVKTSYVFNDTINWVTRNKVTPVVNQNYCGNCWAITATEAVESALAIQLNITPIVLSYQQTTSCDKMDLGCNGGNTNTVLSYYLKETPLVSAITYPFTGGSISNDLDCYDENNCFGTECQNNLINSNTEIVNVITNNIIQPLDISTTYITSGTEEEILNALQNGPVAITFYASNSFNYYSEGIFDGTDCSVSSCNTVNHAMLLVGAGTTDSINYWIVKNSWGEDWGYNGYAYIARGSIYVGLCGILCGLNQATEVNVVPCNNKCSPNEKCIPIINDGIVDYQCISICNNQGIYNNKCNCFRGYSGDNCENTPCSNITCSNNGICKVVSNTTTEIDVKCLCDGNYAGINCENKVTAVSTTACCFGNNCLNNINIVCANCSDSQCCCNLNYGAWVDVSYNYDGTCTCIGSLYY
jgi:C1A family cysteine protease